MVEEVDTDRSERSSLPVYFDDAPYIRHFSARENAEAMGALQKLSPERAHSIAFLYSVADTAYAANYKRYETSRALTSHSLKGPPSLADRRKHLGTLGEINEQQELLLRYASGMLRLWDQFPEKPEILSAEWKEPKQMFKEREEKRNWATARLRHPLITGEINSETELGCAYSASSGIQQRFVKTRRFVQLSRTEVIQTFVFWSEAALHNRQLLAVCCYRLP